MNRHTAQPSRASNWRADNIVLVPASQLPFKEEWIKIARGLPAHEVLFVVPQRETPLKRMARTLVPQLRARGRHITAMLAVAGEHR